MKLLGEIALLQIQRSSLTIGTGPDRYFDPAALLAVEELFLTSSGAYATAADGSCLVDIHNAAHPFTRSRGENTLCFGFSRHYDTMQEKFGAHYTFGCAAENIIIDGLDARVTHADVAAGVVIETDQGLATLGAVIVATPCMPFAKFALRDQDAATQSIKATIQFLDHGLRGFYCAFTGPKTFTIHLGAKVFTIA
ncbi:hypothetical protein [Oleiharenicola lentus]|uniref:hypothetical protein n=1 Tax=Oleiharenicola lentus TaxID=2508720 RepID=UPI003F673CC6